MIKPPSALRAYVTTVALLATCGAASVDTAAPPTNPDGSVKAFVGHFLAAFENLDLEAFIGCFSPSATVFFPIPEPPHRFHGQAAIRQHFQIVFDAIRGNSAAATPPFHRLMPEDLSVTVLSPNVAVVTFHLRNSERLARRTLVVQRGDDSWLISHLHASNVPVQSPPSQPTSAQR